MVQLKTLPKPSSTQDLHPASTSDHVAPLLLISQQISIILQAWARSQHLDMTSKNHHAGSFPSPLTLSAHLPCTSCVPAITTAHQCPILYLCIPTYTHMCRLSWFVPGKAWCLFLFSVYTVLLVKFFLTSSDRTKPLLPFLPSPHDHAPPLKWLYTVLCLHK